MEIKCPACNRKIKFKECICKEQGRKRIALDFPCSHFPSLVYNVPYQVDINTIIKNFKIISKEYFENPYQYQPYHRDRYLDA